MVELVGDDRGGPLWSVVVVRLGGVKGFVGQLEGPYGGVVG